MKRFDYENIYNNLIDAKVMELVAGVHEYKGKQELYASSSPEALSLLEEVARVHSTASSNTIEGIATSDERLRKLVQKKARPKTSAEEEIAGYREVLSLIHDDYDNIELSHSSILQLHKMLYKYSASGFAGKFKTSDNMIVDVARDGTKSVRFKPLNAAQTPQAVKDICKEYNSSVEAGMDPLVLIPVFILDFLCIHPFQDGNGRMSRLLTLLLLYKSGYDVGKYISIEKQIYEHVDLYYETLAASSEAWLINKNDYRPFVRYSISMLIGAYKTLDARASVFAASKPERIASYIKDNYGRVTKTEIMDGCPDISQTTVQRSLNDLVRTKKIQKIGGGRYTYYI